MIICEKCETENENGAMFCKSCRQQLEVEGISKLLDKSIHVVSLKSVTFKSAKILIAIFLILVNLMIITTIGAFVEQVVNNPFAKLVILLIGIWLSTLIWKGIVK